MTKIYLLVFAAQQLMGTWQGVVPADNQAQRAVIKILKDDNGSLQGALYPIDRGPGYLPVTGTARGENITLSMPAWAATFTGKLDSSGNSISGTWTQDRATQPVNLIRATNETAWAIPPDPATARKKMAANVDPTYEVATIKPSRLAAANRSMVRQGPRFNTTATSVMDLMMFAYGVHAKQILNAPRWLDTDTYDVTMLQAGEGQASDAQVKEMMRKLLADRVGLSLHRQQRELPVFRIVTVKDGAKLVESLNPDGPAGWGGGGRAGMMTVKSGTITDVAGFLQRYFALELRLDRPIIDRTGLSARYDFTLRWTPDNATGEFPDFFTAIQQQLGLKLETATESVDVLVIDHVERPSDN